MRNRHVTDFRDHDAAVDGTFTSPKLEGTIAPITEYQSRIPTGLGEGTFRQVLLDSQVNSNVIQTTLNTIAAIAGIHVPDTATRLVEQKANEVYSSLKHILHLPEVNALAMITLNSDWFAGDTNERQIWLKHFLAIMKSESQFKYSVVEINKNSPVSMAQVKPATFQREVSLLKGDRHFEAIKNSDLFQSLFKTHNLSTDLVKNAAGFQAVAGSFTIVPMIHFMFLHSLFKDRFIWFKGKWTCVRTTDSNSPVWSGIKDKSYISSFYLGRQALLTLLHISPNFAALTFFKYPKRFNQDIINFLGYVNAVAKAPTDVLGDVFCPTNKWNFVEGFGFGDNQDPVHIRQGYRAKKDAKHKHAHYGYDLDAKTGQAIYAVAKGKVTYARWQNPSQHSGSKSGWGRNVRILHPNGYQTLYAHLDSFAVPENYQIKEGEVLGYADASGFTTGPTGVHLHIEIMKPDGSKGINPDKFKGTEMDLRKAISPTANKLKL